MSYYGFAWLTLCLALAIHVADEAFTDFLSVYNPVARAIRHRVPLLPVPTFSFGVWLGGLIVGTLLLLCLTPFASREASWMKPLSTVFGIMMVGNALLHLTGSLYSRRAMPGLISSPLLLASAIYLLAFSLPCR
jgi:Protein of unknown function with HXXEE motif